MISEVNDSEQGTLRRFRVLTPRISITVLILVYLPLALTFSLMTRAWEAEDESSHTHYIEYIVGHQALPHISAANGLESHQPPLYYLIAAGWQELLHIPAFTPTFVGNSSTGFLATRLVYSHDYTPIQHQDAVY